MGETMAYFIWTLSRELGWQKQIQLEVHLWDVIPRGQARLIQYTRPVRVGDLYAIDLDPYMFGRAQNVNPLVMVSYTLIARVENDCKPYKGLLGG
jgi:hypothetical protein